MTSKATIDTGCDPQWICVAIACGADHGDDLAALVAEHFGVGVEITAHGVRFYLPNQGIGDLEWHAGLAEVLDEFRALHGVDAPLPWSTHLVEDDGWADRWKEHFKPLRVGRHFIVCPTWEEPHAGQGDRVIRIDPGQAFGTGHHETTRLCLEWLEAYDDLLRQQDREQTPPSRRPSLLDVGTGSGILAIGAAVLGWHEVVAIDLDPEAVQVAAENLQLNSTNKCVRLVTGDVYQVPERFDVVMANIQALPLIRMAEVLKVKLNPRGHLVLSGILQEQRDMLVAAFTDQSLHLVTERPAGEWCLLEFVPVPGGKDGS
ncbi:MAG TPA: 50S ribosomal protein L11 methyltransferase [Syntrophobacteraceae bacterium]|nr:50S ribosomal protein L11 methyltransferase [Syntrophobacteraceae bacterium]